MSVRFTSPALCSEHEALSNGSGRGSDSLHPPQIADPFPSPAPRPRRLLSWLWDYLIILCWLLLVFLVVGLPQILGWVDLAPVWTDQNSSDVGITLLTVLPYFAYLFITEVSPRHATWGKRRASIGVYGSDCSSPGRGSVAVRNLIKVAPWQLGHMGTTRLVTSPEVTDTAIGLQIGSLILLALIVVPILLDRRGLHDFLARSQVSSREP